MAKKKKASKKQTTSKYRNNAKRKTGKVSRKSSSKSKRRTGIRKKKTQKWYVRYFIKDESKRKRDFEGELIFETTRKLTTKQANQIANKLFQGKTPKQVSFIGFEYLSPGKAKTISDIDDLPDYDFLMADDEDSDNYISETRKG
jgi:hypothetical protein